MTPVTLSSVKADYGRIGLVLANVLENLPERNVPDAITETIPGEIVQRESSRSYAFQDSLVAEIMKLIQEEALQMKSIGELSSRFPVSRRSMEIHFKKATGKTMYEMVLQNRIRFACRLLRDENTGIKDIAKQAGFTSEQRFFAAFKQILGTTPKEYQKQTSRKYDEDIFHHRQE